MLPLLRATNGHRATMLMPQGLDATHGGELFPVNESFDFGERTKHRLPTVVLIGHGVTRFFESPDQNASMFSIS